MKKKSILILIFILIVCTGCSSQPTITNIEFNEMQTTINGLRQQVLDQGMKIYMLEQLLSNTATLDPLSEGYSKSGEFLVAISKVEEYLDGLKVYLEIGNPTYAKHRMSAINVKYGSKYDFNNTSITYDEWRNSLSEKEIPTSTELNKGAWNNLEIVLPSISPKDFSHIEIQIITDSISLITE